MSGLGRRDSDGCCGIEFGSAGRRLLSGFAWCEAFVGLGLHCFWVLFKSSPLAVDNAWGALLGVTPFVVMLGVGAFAMSERLAGALVRLGALLHLTACALLSALVFYVVWHDPFSAFVPLGSPMLLWSAGLSFALAGNISTHLRERASGRPSVPGASAGLTLVSVALWWGGSLWVASGAVWAAYFWSVSIVLHALLAVAAMRDGAPVAAKTRVSWLERFAGMGETLFLLGVLFLALVRGVYGSAGMGTAEAKWLLFLDAYRAPAFFVGLLLFLAALRWRFVELAHVIVALVVFHTDKTAAWPLAVALGYGLPALFRATRRLSALGYALSACLMTLSWIVGVFGFLFAGMTVHFNYGLAEVDLIMKWGILLLMLPGTLFLVFTWGARWRRARGADETAVREFTSAGTLLCGTLFCAILLVATVPGVAVLVATMWPPFFLDRPDRLPVGEPMGVCHAGYSQSDEEYRILDALGVQALRADFTWGNIQPASDKWSFDEKDGYVDTAAKHGKHVIALLDFDNDTVEQDPVGRKRGMYIAPSDIPLFLEYVRRTVDHFRGRVYAWEIWNEPDIARFWDGPMDEFYALARQTAETVRATDPNARIIGTAMTGPFGAAVAAGVEGMHRSGALAQADHPSCHLYVTDARHYAPEFLKIIGAARRFGHPGSIWITELGAPDGGYYPWGSLSEDLAPRLIKAYTFATSFGMDMLVWYCYHDADAGSQAQLPIEAERFFGLIGPDEQWKPSAYAYQLFSRCCSHSAVRADLVHATGGLAARQLRTALYRKDNGDSTLILWFEPMLRPWGSARVRLDLGLGEGHGVVHDIESNYSKALLDDYVNVTDKPVVITFKAPGSESTVGVHVTGSPVDGLWLGLLVVVTMGSLLSCLRLSGAAKCDV